MGKVLKLRPIAKFPSFPRHIALSKLHRQGTHRAKVPNYTVSVLRRLCNRFGITRIANVTGLDRIGLPIVMVVRPESKSLAVAQGKGIDLASATASGLMESIETWHAERVTPERVASFAELRAGEQAIDVWGLPPRQQSRLHEDLAIPWIAGVDLLSGKKTWVPFALVHSDYSLPPPPGAGCFCASTNGLASGNILEEALIHGIAEVIERDALAIWHHRSAGERVATLVDLTTIDDPDVVQLLERLDAADMAVSVFDAASDVGVPVFHAEIVERGLRKPLFFPRVISGDGCHPARNIALLRALTEAAQSRLTFISGSRDDITEDDYDPIQDRLGKAGHRALETALPGINYRDVPTFESDFFEQDLDHLFQRLEAIGITQVAMVDLSRPEFEGIVVVRVVIPGLATVVDHPNAAHWRRLPARPRLQVQPLAEAMM